MNFTNDFLIKYNPVYLIGFFVLVRAESDIFIMEIFGKFLKQPYLR